MPRITAALIGAGNRGLRTYGRFAEGSPHRLAFTAVADPDPERRERFAAIHGIAADRRFTSWEELLSEPKRCDAVFVCTQDRMHYEPTVAALKRGYHVLLEKPMSQDAAECIRMARVAGDTGRLLMVGHVLRYAPFFAALKRMVSAGRIGEIVSIQHSENIGYWHFAHSFVRGNWSRTAESSPMILAKSCHDMDLLAWLAEGRSCLRLCSFGSLIHFRRENAPPGAPPRCTDGCPAEKECPYSALKLYLGTSAGPWRARGFHPVSFITLERLKRIVSHDVDAVLRELERGPYGRCVYRCDNDVVDHQVVSLEFDGGLSASFTVCAHTAEWLRTIKIMGTRGEIRGHQGKNEIEVLDFTDGSRELVQTAGGGGHGGGDEGLIADFIRRVASPVAGEALASASLSVQGHLMAMAAEKSRLEERSIDMAEFTREQDAR